MAKENEEVKNADQGTQPKKSKLKLIILVSAVLILGAGGYFGWKWYPKGKKETVAAKQEAVSLIYPLKPFIVNLFDNKGVGNRYLKVVMELELEGEGNKVIVEANLPQLRDTILLLLSSQTLKEVNSLEGKLELKQELLLSVNRVLGREIIQRIYFAEFVVQ
ncbi:MAG: flagellar basal body-associated FliL family protein [Proteobacteria bacterium]|nr:flagellar basal body-associated FliL family protein [Pseudomonadota bacterium]